MKELKSPVKSSELNIQESQLPLEYIEKAKLLIKERETAESELRKNQKAINGKDDRLCRQLYELDIKLRKDISKLREEFKLN